MTVYPSSRPNTDTVTHSGSEDSLPDPQHQRVKCPKCKEWMRPTRLAIHVSEEHPDLSLSPGRISKQYILYIYNIVCLMVP